MIMFRVYPQDHMYNMCNRCNMYIVHNMYNTHNTYNMYIVYNTYNAHRGRGGVRATSLFLMAAHRTSTQVNSHGDLNRHSISNISYTCRTQFVHNSFTCRTPVAPISYIVQCSFISVQCSHRQCFGIAAGNNQIKLSSISPWPNKGRHQSSRAHTLGNCKHALDLTF